MGDKVREMRRGKLCGTQAPPLNEMSGNQRVMCRGGIEFDLILSRPGLAVTLRIY